MFLIGCSKDESDRIEYTKPHCISSQEVCVKKTAFGDLSILFNVATVMAETPFQISVIHSSNAHHFKVFGFIEGKDMYMGKIPLFFERDNASGFVSDVLLGSCSQETMIWRMWITIQEDGPNPNRPEQTSDTFFIDFTSTRYLQFKH